MQAEQTGQSQVVPNKPLRQRFIKGAIRFLSWVLLRLRFEGKENIPATGGMIIVTNHLSQVDSAILLLNPVRSDTAPLAADKYKNHPIISYMMNSFPHIWIDRSKADFAAFRAAIDYLKQGGCIGVAPEGTRSKVGSLIEGKSGAVLLAVRAGAPIVPVGIAGTESFAKNLLRLKRTPVIARFGKPFTLSPLDPQDRNGPLQQATDEVMCQIAAQLPEKYHGVYAGRERIQEIIRETGSI